MHPSLSSRRTRLIFAVMTFLLLGLPVQAWSVHNSKERVTLKGIPAIDVVVARLNANAERDGLTEGQLQTDVEVRLRKAGIRLTSSLAEGEGILYLNVNALKQPSGQYAFSIRLEFTQEGTLKRNPDVSPVATTWRRAGAVAAQSLSSYVRDRVADMVDQFINAYLEQNPKQ